MSCSNLWTHDPCDKRKLQRRRVQKKGGSGKGRDFGAIVLGRTTASKVEKSSAWRWNSCGWLETKKEVRKKYDSLRDIRGTKER